MGESLVATKKEDIILEDELEDLVDDLEEDDFDDEKELNEMIKLDFLYKVRPNLILDDTIYRRMKIEYLNRKRYTMDEIIRGCSTMDVDNDPLNF